MENQSTYRIRTKLGETEPINIPISFMQEYNSFEVLSLKLNVNENYNTYKSTEGIVVGRVSTANNGLGIPNVRVSIFVPKGQYSQTEEEEVLYPFSSPTDKDGDKIRYNLLPSESDVDCYQVIGTMPSKRKILDNETVCEVFEKYYKYTTVTNEAGDFMLTNIPVGNQRIHIDADLSDIGPFLSQRPYDMIENLGFNKNKFDSTRQFKTSNDLDSLAQVISQTKSVYVYPYWGDVTENNSDLKITRTDLSLNYEFKTSAIFIGSVITDKQSNSIMQNCTATPKSGKMSDMVTGAGRIEMIRKTIDNKVEQYRIKGDDLINDDGVWCYMIPMNLDYVRTDEFGNIIPTDDPNKGVPTRARVRFRVTLNQMDSDEDAHKRCSYLVPNNPKITDEEFLNNNDADYSFGSETWDESFVDLFWNKVYSVKSYIPQLQKNTNETDRKHTGIKTVNHYGDNNPFPYNGLTIKLTFIYRLICVIASMVIEAIGVINSIISVIGKIGKWALLGLSDLLVPKCMALSQKLIGDDFNEFVVYPGCKGSSWGKTLKDCNKQQAKSVAEGKIPAECTNDKDKAKNTIESQLAEENECTSFNFSNDWINGCLYMPLWYRRIRPKQSFFFGIFKKDAKDQWCSANATYGDLQLITFCAHGNSGTVNVDDYNGKSHSYHFTKRKDDCGTSCHEKNTAIVMKNGIVVNRENIYGQKLWYYRSIETDTSETYVSEYTYKNIPRFSKTLFATDIILLGSMNDCDLNGVPKFYNYLKASSYLLPTDLLFTDREIQYHYENGELINATIKKMSVASGCDWGITNEYYNKKIDDTKYDGGLFYGIGCSTIERNTPSCINVRRICELGVGLDEIKYVENINTDINSESDNLDLNKDENYLRPDGFVSYDDIIDFNYRSMFATMNGNHLKTKINTTTGIREYDFRHLYIDNFDGSLYDFMFQRQSGYTNNVNYRNNYKLETTSNDYLTFRYGDNPYYYDRKYSFPKYENSFYFYFGLKEGKTAIDLFNEQYNGKCATSTNEEETIKYTKKTNSWCNLDSDSEGLYNHETFDGYLTFNLDKFPLPCSMVFNSKDNASVSYTVVKMNGKEIDENDTYVTDENIRFYGTLDAEEEEKLKDYERYALLYENASLDGEAKQCYMINNGEYVLYLTDGEGNQYVYNIDFKGKYLSFNDAERAFGEPNNILLSYYEQYLGKSKYNSVAISPAEDNKFEIEFDDTQVPIVTRRDKQKKYTVSQQVGNENGIKLNGTICIYNVAIDGEAVNNYVIEVEPNDKDLNGNYSDKDFWENDETQDNTWYKVAWAVITDNNYNGPCSVVEENSKSRIYTTDGKKEYFYTKTIDGKLYIVVKCPKGDVNYNVTITELCNDGNVWYKSSNTVSKKIYIGEPSPYKLYINDVDYDVIKNFDTGYVLKTDENLQFLEETKEGPTPFESFGNAVNQSSFNKIRGWLEIGNIDNEYYDWSVDETTYGTNVNTTKDENGNFKIKTELENQTTLVNELYQGMIGLQEEINELNDVIEALALEAATASDEMDDLKEESDTLKAEADALAMVVNELAETLIKSVIKVEKLEAELAKLVPGTPPYKDKEKELNDEKEKLAKKKEEYANEKSEYNVKKSEYDEKAEEFDKKQKLYYDKIGVRDDKQAEYDEKGIIYNEELVKQEDLTTEVRYLDNRLGFIETVKNAFWLMSEDDEKSITYRVKTDDTPYNVYTVYNAEEISDVDENYNQTKSVAKTPTQGITLNKWLCKGETTTNISGIKIPTITAYINADFGVPNDDKTRQSAAFTETYNDDKTTCFAQDNIEKKSETNTISIKPPYLVACVNKEGNTKPDGLTVTDFFSKTKNEYGLETYEFGKNKSLNKGLLKLDDKEFFGFHIIDKTFAPDIVCWPYINDIPYFLPWMNYDGSGDVSYMNKVGRNISVEGILSGNINNGVSNGTIDEYGCVNDFEECTVYSKTTPIITYNGDDEDSIPTRRCILNPLFKEFDDKYTLESYEKQLVEKKEEIKKYKEGESEYKKIKKEIEDLEKKINVIEKNIKAFEDAKSKYIEAEEKVERLNKELNSLTKGTPEYISKENEWQGAKNSCDSFKTEYELQRDKLYIRTEEDEDGTFVYKDYRFTTSDDVKYGLQHIEIPNRQGTLSVVDNSENTATRELYGTMKIKLGSATLNQHPEMTVLYVDCVNCDSSEPITYHIYGASRKSEITDSTYVSWYPLNAFERNVDKENNESFSLNCNCIGDDVTEWEWDRTTATAVHLFNKNTDLGDGITVNISTTTENNAADENRTTSDSTALIYRGNGNGVDHKPLFVIAETKSGCRAISPVYDFTLVRCVYGVRDVTITTEGGEQKQTHFFTVMPINILCDKNNKTDADTRDYELPKQMAGYGWSSYDNDTTYTKKPRNYYLTQYDFTLSFELTDSSKAGSYERTYKYFRNKYVNSIEELKSITKVGYQYCKPFGGVSYFLFDNNGGYLDLDNNNKTVPYDEEGKTIEELTKGKIQLKLNTTYYYTVYQELEEKETTPKEKYQLVNFAFNGTTFVCQMSSLQNTVPEGVEKIIDPYAENYNDNKYCVIYTQKHKNSDGEVGKWVEIYYCDIIYSLTKENENSPIHDANPEAPYFHKPIDIEIDQDELNAIKQNLRDKQRNYLKVYVTDVTGLRHLCYTEVLTNDDSAKWDKIMKCSYE